MSTILTPSSKATQAVFLKSHIKMLRVGLRNSQITPTQMLQKVAAITGATYKRATTAEFDRAIADLQAVIDAATT